MYIKSSKLKNFKCFSEEIIDFCVPDGTTPGSGLNILVGENNSGKSSLMEAIYFLRNKSKKDLRKIGSVEDQEYFVEIVFGGDVESAIDNFAPEAKRDNYKNCLQEDGGEKVLRLKRNFGSAEEQKNIWVDKGGSYEKNPGGIDASLQSFFQISNIWAHTSPEEEGKFGSTTICGNLLADISEKFKLDHKDQYEEFSRVFHRTFNDNNAGLQGDLNKVATDTESILNEQFGAASLKFKFEPPEIATFFKNIKILVNDGEETELNEKGHGMQRAVILSLLQVYARRLTEIRAEGANEIKLKPHFLFIDEPEMGLHPQAQQKLFEALKSIAKDHQVFIATHSSYFIDPDLIKNIYRFEKHAAGVTVFSGKKLNIDLHENRKFFLHHHKLFFAKRALFVEGVDDLSRLGMYCKRNGHNNLNQELYLMAGCANYLMFRDLCDGFHITSNFIFDVDVLSVTNTVNRNFPAAVQTDISSLAKTTTKKNPSNLQDVNLDPAEQALKKSAISKLRTERLFVFSDGAIEQYLDDGGEVVDGDSQKDTELKDILVDVQRS